MGVPWLEEGTEMDLFSWKEYSPFCHHSLLDDTWTILIICYLPGSMAFECKICELNCTQNCFLLGCFGAWNVTIQEFLLLLKNPVRQPEAGMSLLPAKDDTRRGRSGLASQATLPKDGQWVCCACWA